MGLLDTGTVLANVASRNRYGCFIQSCALTTKVAMKLVLFL